MINCNIRLGRVENKVNSLISIETCAVGVVEAWEELPTGSWYAHGAKDKLWLTRLKLRKVDGELTLLVIDDSTSIAKLEAATT